MKNTTYLQGAFILTLTNLITGVLSFIYRIFLTRSIGAEGIGVYQLVLPLYYLFITLVAGGLVTSISKIVAENRVKYNYSNINKIIKVSIILSGLWSIIFCIVIAINAEFLANYVLKDSRTTYSIIVFSPAIIFIALSSVLKGYFYGIEKVSIPAIIDIAEKLLRLIFLIFSTKYFIDYGIEFVCAGAMMAMVWGEILSLILLYLPYKKKKNVASSFMAINSTGSIIRSILISLIPLSISGAIESILDMVDAVLIPSMLIKAGFSKENSLSMYGKLTGMIMPLLYFPMIIIGSLSTTLIPSIAFSYASSNYAALNKKCNDSIIIASVIGFASSIIFITYPEELCQVLFNCPEAGVLLFWSAFPCLFEYWLFTLMAIMNGMSLQNKVLECSLANIFIMTLSIVFFMPMPKINIYAYLIGFALSSSFVVLRSINIILKNTPIRFDIHKTVINPFFCSIPMLISIKSINNYLITYTSTQYNMILSYWVGLIIYFIMLFITGTLRPKQLLNVLKLNMKA